jgi:hypothetical protein
MGVMSAPASRDSPEPVTALARGIRAGERSRVAHSTMLIAQAAEKLLKSLDKRLGHEKEATE